MSTDVRAWGWAGGQGRGVGVEVLLPVQGQVLLFDEINIAYRLVRTPPQPQGNTSSGIGKCVAKEKGAVGIPPPWVMHAWGREEGGEGGEGEGRGLVGLVYLRMWHVGLLLLVVWEAWGIRRLMRRWWRRPGPTRPAWPSHDHHHHNNKGQQGRR